MTSTPDLTQYGIGDTTEIVYNPSYESLFTEETAASLEGFEDGQSTESGAIAVGTGDFIGRSLKDKYLVRDDTTRDAIWWSVQGDDGNKPIEPETWAALRNLVTTQLSGKRLFVVDTYCCANADTRLAVRFVTQVAWQAHFVTNMFIRPEADELENYSPDFVVLNGFKTTNPDFQPMGLNSENFVAFNMTDGMQIIGGTWYGGEMEKGMFSMMNYLLPLKGIPSMHCSAKIGKDASGKRISIKTTHSIIEPRNSFLKSEIVGLDRSYLERSEMREV